MKMLMIIYNEALDNEVMEALDSSSINGYTKIAKVFGRGKKSGTHLGTDIWPGLNNILYVACEKIQFDKFIAQVKELRDRAGNEGVKAFVLPLEEIDKTSF